VLNPIPRPDGSLPEVVRRLALRADAVVSYSRRHHASLIEAGLPPRTSVFLRLGTLARVAAPGAPGSYLVAAGREDRDWPTLARAAEQCATPLTVVGPVGDVNFPRHVTTLASLPRGDLLELMRDSAGVVIPLRSARRPAGQLALLDSLSVGRPVVATRTAGTEDYVTEDLGRLVDPADADGLAAAMSAVAAPELSFRLAGGAFAAATGELSLARFVREVHHVAASL